MATMPRLMEPQLPMLDYTCTATWQPERIRAAAVYCSDGRWGAAFDEFCQRRLNFPRYDRVAVPGGPAWITGLGGLRPELQEIVRHELDFLVRVHELQRIVIITHFGCAFYTEHLGLSPEEALEQQFGDAQSAVRQLREWFPNVTVDAHLAMRRERMVAFHELKPGSVAELRKHDGRVRL